MLFVCQQNNSPRTEHKWTKFVVVEEDGKIKRKFKSRLDLAKCYGAKKKKFLYVCL